MPDIIMSDIVIDIISDVTIYVDRPKYEIASTSPLGYKNHPESPDDIISGLGHSICIEGGCPQAQILGSPLIHIIEWFDIQLQLYSLLLTVIWYPCLLS